jgi:hypothetical protein
MPLHSQNEVAGRIQLDRLDGPICGGNRAHPQIVSGEPDGLMMAGVDLSFNRVGRRQKPCQPGPLRNPHRVCLDHLSAGLVIDRRLQILDQRAVAPDIHSLGAGADAKNWLVEVERILQEQFVDGGASSMPCTPESNLATRS